MNIHSEMEERVLYPALRQFAPEKVDEAIDEHSEVKDLLLELLESDLDEDAFESQFTRLVEDVRHHGRRRGIAKRPSCPGATAF